MLYYLYSFIEYIASWFRGDNELSASFYNINNEEHRNSLKKNVRYFEENLNIMISNSKYDSILDIHKLILTYDNDVGNLYNIENTISWFDKQIEERSKNKNIKEKIDLLLLKVEYANWVEIQKQRYR